MPLTVKLLMVSLGSDIHLLCLQFIGQRKSMATSHPKGKEVKFYHCVEEREVLMKSINK